MIVHFRIRFAAISLAISLVALAPLTASTAFSDSAESALARGASAYPAGQAALIQTQDAHRGANFIEVSGVTVSRVLPDDTSGSKHQKWVVQLANGREVACVYNIDVTPRISLKVGDVLSLGGQYIYTSDGGLLHWLHEDAHGHRPNGYVEHNGIRYGANGGTGIYKP